MIPPSIVAYLRKHNVPFARRWHPRAYTAQQVAATLHVTGYRVAKSVIVQADGKRYIAVLPAPEIVDEPRLAKVLGSSDVRLLGETEFEGMFPECEVGAEPPFGGLYGLPVVVDSRLADEGPVMFRAGSHEEVIELQYQDFVALEKPAVGSFGRLYPAAPRMEAEPTHP